MEDETELVEDGEILETEDCDTSSAIDQFSISRATREPKTICSDESSNENSEENSDDDSDAQCSKPKRLKAQPELPVANKVPNKYKVWSIALQEEALTETLTKCDVEAMCDKERNVESYNYKLVDKTDYSQYSGYRVPVPECHYIDSDFHEYSDDRPLLVGRKRRHKDIKKRLGHRKHFQGRQLPKLTVTADNSAEEVAEDIAHKLREQKKELILNVVLVLGKEKAIALYNETKGVEDNGGMLLMNGERRRTSGGVYLLLIKRDDSISSDAMKKIFANDMDSARNNRRIAKKNHRRKKQQEIKEMLIREKLLSLNTTTFLQNQETKQPDGLLGAEISNLEEGEVELTVTNPPPSPATDQDTPPPRVLSDDEAEHDPVCATTTSSTLGRPIVTYDDDDDYLEVDFDADNMDLF